MLSGGLVREEIENVELLDESVLDAGGGGWRLGFDAGGFYQDIDWAIKNAKSMARQLERLLEHQVGLDE